MFTGISIQEFSDFFTCEDVCKDYLFQLKWKDGFSCFRCGCKTSLKGHTSFHKRCKNCNYEESLTANTSLHKLKIPLMKAFGIVYRMTIPNTSPTPADLAMEYKINPKTAWSFAHKVRQVMVLDDDFDESNVIDPLRVIDSLIICGGERKHSGLQQVYVSIGQKESPQCHGRNHVTVKCKLPEIPFKINCELLFGKFVKQNKDIRLWNFKTSFTGSHRRCSQKYLQRYVNEFYFKSHFRNEKDLIMHNVLARLMMRKTRSGNDFGPN